MYLFRGTENVVSQSDVTLEKIRDWRNDTAKVMSFAAELERTTEGLATLCRRSFGPCGEETLLFRPPEAPIVTGEGQAVLAAWKRGLDAEDPLATFLLTAANGVHQQLGDGSSEFILLVNAATRHASEVLSGGQDARNAVDRARLSRAFAELKWELQRETPHLCALKLAVPVELDVQTMLPSKRFREASSSILVSALRGVLGEQAVEFVAELVLNWVFTPPPCTSDFIVCASERTDKLLFRRVQQFLKCASDAIISMTAPSVYASYVVPRDEFILKKSVVTSQPPGILDRCQGPVRFVCFKCPLSLSDGSNHVELATTTDEELFTAQDAANMFIAKFVRQLRDRLHVQLIVSTEALDESVIAACTRQEIACVQLAEPEDVEALCISAGIFPLASVFDDIRMTEHIGVCANGVSRVRFQQQACLLLKGLAKPSKQNEEKRHRGRRLQDIVVPQLLVHAPTKGVYKQYFAAIVKSLRVLRSWWEPISANADDLGHSHQPATAYSCRGGGATELAVARWLQDGSDTLFSNALPRDAVMQSLARHIVANALIEVVSILRSNLSQTCQSASDEGHTPNQRVGKQRQVLLDAFSKPKLQNLPRQPEAFHGYTLDYSQVLQTLAGPIQIPALVFGDPEIYGLVHPWRRIDTLLFLVLQTLEQLFRIDRVFSKTAAPTTKTK